MKRRILCAALFVLLPFPVWTRAAGPELPPGQVTAGRSGPRPAEAGPPSLVENPLGDVPPDDPKMESYSHGNYLLVLVHFLWSAGLLAFIVVSGLAARLQDLAESVSRSANLKVAVYSVLFATLTFVGGFPLAVYSGYLREKTYGFANQPFAGWLGDWAKALLVGVLLQVVFFVILYSAIRRLGRRWWVAGSVLAILSAILVIAVAPVLIAPLFNRFEPLKDASLRAEILEMARREGIPAEEVYEMDASRQSNHNNAYVAGLLGTQRIVLYDTILKTFAPREVKFIMGHEMGHYVLHHVWKTVAFLSFLIVPGFFFADRLTRRVITCRPALRIASLAEPSSLPLIVLALSVFLFLVEPVIATFSRMQEHRADLFGLRVTHDPIAAASSFLKFGRLDLDEYHVHPWIETLLYSHPSLTRRIHTAQEYARLHGSKDVEGKGTDGPAAP